MRWLFALTLLSSACGGGDDFGAPCSATKPCASGVCDLTDPGGPVCVDPDADDDGDGLPNKLDFCQHMDGGQYDEDLDGLGDICDACPIAAPPATPDPDGDAVDSPCDPDPTTKGDKIVVFEGFNTGAMPTGFTVSAGWTFQGGEAIATPSSPTATVSLTTALPLVSSHIAVLSRWRVDRVDTQATENAAQVLALDRRPAGLTTVTCGSSQIGGMDRLVVDTGNGTAQDLVDMLFDPASLYRAALKIDAAQAQCAVIGDHDTGAAQQMTTGENMTEAGLAAKGATIRFGYLLAVQRPL